MPRAAESQAGPSRARTTRGRSQTQAEEENSSEDEVVRPTQAGGVGKNAAEKAKDLMGPSTFSKKRSSLIRLLLFHAHTRTPLRREEINRLIIIDKKSFPVFPLLMSEAIEKFRENFGMEVVELRGKSGGLPVGIEVGRKKKTGEVDADEPVGTKKASIPSTKSYILRSSLPSFLTPHMTVPNPLFEPNSASNNEDEEDEAPNRGGRQVEGDCGAVLDWKDGDGGTGAGVGFQGLLWVLLGMILVNDRQMSERTLFNYFQTHLQISPETLLPFSSPKTTTTTSLTLPTLLTALVKQSYLERVKSDRDPSIRQVGEAGPGGGEGGGGEAWEYRWGARSEAEIGERAVAEFMAEVSEAARRNVTASGEEDEDDDDDDDDVAQPGPVRESGGNGRNGNNGDQAKTTAKDRKMDILKRIELGSGGKLGGMTIAVPVVDT